MFSDLTEGQSLLLGGAVSLITAIAVLLLQALFESRRSVREARRVAVQRFFDYDLERLRKLEELFLELKGLAYERKVIGNVGDRIMDLVLLSSPDKRTSDMLFGVLRRVFHQFAEILNGEKGAPLESWEEVELGAAILDFLRVYRRVVLNEPKKTILTFEDFDEIMEPR